MPSVQTILTLEKKGGRFLTYLVTGCSGFIGSHLINELKKKERVVGLIRDCKPSLWFHEVLEDIILVRGDVRDLKLLKRVINQYEVDRVFHLAAFSIVKRAYRDPVNTFETNIMGTVNVLEACRQVGVERIVFLSTDKVYGNLEKATTRDTIQATEVYGTSKACAGLIAQTYASIYDLPVMAIRLCNVYGYDPYNNRIVPNTIKTALQCENPIIYKNDYSKRQYIYVDDAVNALTFAMENFTQSEVVNVGTPDIMTQEGVVLSILKFFPGLEPDYVDRPPYKEIRSQSMQSNLAGWKPRYSFDEGIVETILLFNKYKEDWWRE